MAEDSRRDLLGGLISFGLETLALVMLGVVAGVLAWLAIGLVG